MRGRLSELQDRIQKRPAMLIAMLVGFWFIWSFGYNTFWARLNTEIEGTITAKHAVSTSGRSGTIYIVRDSYGTNREYVAGATDASLSRDLTVGTVIAKRRWQITSLKDGVTVYDFPTVFYVAIIGAAFACLIWGGFQLLKPTRN
jgi:hypothetical protein